MTTKLSKHTPGPWHVVTSGLIRQGKQPSGPGSNIFAISYSVGYTATAEEKAANARLISLAWMLPDLVEVAELLAAWDQSNDDAALISEACSKARAVLARYHEQEK